MLLQIMGEIAPDSKWATRKDAQGLNAASSKVTFAKTSQKHGDTMMTNSEFNNSTHTYPVGPIEVATINIRNICTIAIL